MIVGNRILSDWYATETNAHKFRLGKIRKSEAIKTRNEFLIRGGEWICSDGKHRITEANQEKSCQEN
jgi:hypothetical protein